MTLTDQITHDLGHKAAKDAANTIRRVADLHPDMHARPAVVIQAIAELMGMAARLIIDRFETTAEETAHVMLLQARPHMIAHIELAMAAAGLRKDRTH